MGIAKRIATERSGMHQHGFQRRFGAFEWDGPPLYTQRGETAEQDETGQEGGSVTGHLSIVKGNGNGQA